jgi:hypothetical protein
MSKETEIDKASALHWKTPMKDLDDNFIRQRLYVYTILCDKYVTKFTAEKCGMIRPTNDPFILVIRSYRRAPSLNLRDMTLMYVVMSFDRGTTIDLPKEGCPTSEVKEKKSKLVKSSTKIEISDDIATYLKSNYPDYVVVGRQFSAAMMRLLESEGILRIL